VTSSHIFFIPLVLLVGLVLGIALGRRSVLVQQAEEERQKKLAERRAARAAGGGATAPIPGAAPDPNAPPPEAPPR